MIDYNIIKDNEPIIYSIINKYSAYFDKEDLYQVAIIGLINAYKNYNTNKNTKFSSYAYYYILGEVFKYIRDTNTFKVSKELVKLCSSIEKAREILSQKYNKEPTKKELSLFLEVEEKDIDNAYMASSLIKSLDSENIDDISLYDKVSFEDNSFDSDILDLKFEIENLDDFSKKLITERYINDLSQSDTSSVLGISQVQVSRKEKEILTRLRTRLK